MNKLRIRIIVLSMYEWTKDDKDCTKYGWMN